MNIFKRFKNLLIKEYKEPSKYVCSTIECGRKFNTHKGLLIHRRHKINNGCKLHTIKEVDGYRNP